MSKSIYQLIKDMQDYFKYRKPLHLSFGRKIVPTYIVNPVPEIKSDEVLNEALTQNTWYTVFEGNNVEVGKVLIYQLVANEDLEVRVTDDAGVATVVAWTAVAATSYFLRRFANDFTVATRYAQTTSEFVNGSMWSSRYLKIELRKTTAAGANATQCRVCYSQW